MKMDGEEKENANVQKKDSDGEDDIPLDLILKEEPFEMINNGIEPIVQQDVTGGGKPASKNDELCAFENCGICHQNVVLGQGKWGSTFSAKINK